MSAGVELMLIGMGIVFAFLALLVIMVSMMTLLIQRFFPETAQTNLSPVASVSQSHVAAIGVAIHQYRNKYKLIQLKNNNPKRL